jgi:hypothetical protein
MTRRLRLLAVLVAIAALGCGPSTSDVASPSTVSTPESGPSGSPTTPSPTGTLAIPSSPPRPTGMPVPTPAPWTPCPGRDPGRADRPGPRTTTYSANWAGYVVPAARHTVTCVEGSWVQPTVTCPARGQAEVEIWVGIGGYENRYLEQIGTGTQCSDGQQTSFAWEEILPQEPVFRSVNLPVRPGDQISAQVWYRSKNLFHFRIDNLTQGLSVSFDRTVLHAPRDSVEWIVEAGSAGCPKHCAVQPLANFDRIRFTDCDATIAKERGPIDDAAWTHVRVTTQRGSIVRAVPWGIDGTGQRFLVVWAHR